MASLFKKPNSPFWYLRHLKDGKWVKESTGLRHDDPNETAQARELRALAEAKEHGKKVSTGGWDWVERYLKESELAPRSIEKYLSGWAWMALWLTEKGLSPGELRYPHALEYLDWRIGRKKSSGKTAGRNTAIMELKILSSILNEAVRREIITANPLARLKLKKAASAKKPDLTDEEVTICLAALERESAEDPEMVWMLDSFDIALATGCRLRETKIPLDKILLDLKIPTMTFPSPKGGESKAFTIPVPDNLIPKFRRMKQEKGREFTIEKFPFQPSRVWQHFFKRVGLPHLTFHCLRVTKVTRLRREGVPREVAMRLVNHSQELVHLLYDRHRVDDLSAYRNSGIAGSAAATPENPTNKRGGRRAGKSGR